MTTLHPNQSPAHARIRSPLAKVRGLGSAKEGTDHFWKQRITGIANIFLVVFALVFVIKLAGADYATVKKTLAKPLVSILFLLLVLSGVMHMRLGMQTIIEDYVASEGRKIALLMLNTFFAITIGLTCLYAVFKLSLGA
jgi:succinate dehydrogenase / fumarate reductase, membrane anchor subunit